MASVVAVAGTGGVGRTIAEQVVSETTSRVVILTRRDPSLLAKLDRVQYVQVDYDDIPSLSQELDRQVVTTVICAIGMWSEASSVSQRNLIEAATQSKTVQRFIPSEFGYLTTEENKKVDPGVTWHLEAAALLKQSRLMYTRIACGGFMDFLGMPHVRTHLPPLFIAIDVENCRAAIPGDGNDSFGVAYSFDVASMIAKLLSLDQWSEFSNCVVQDVTFNEIVQIAEEVRGRKFQVKYSKVEDVVSGRMEVLPRPPRSKIGDHEFREFNIFAGSLVVTACARIPAENRLCKTFAGFHPKTVRQFITEVWEGR